MTGLNVTQKLVDSVRAYCDRFGLEVRCDLTDDEWDGPGDRVLIAGFHPGLEHDVPAIYVLEEPQHGHRCWADHGDHTGVAWKQHGGTQPVVRFLVDRCVQTGVPFDEGGGST